LGIEEGKLSSIISEIFQRLPPESQVSRIEFEGPKIALYTKNLKFFMQNPTVIPSIVSAIKKHVVVKADESERKEEEEAREEISRLIPKEAGVSGIIFDGIQGEILIEVKDPSLLEGEIKSKIDEVAQEIGWKVKIRRVIYHNPQTYEFLVHTLKTNEEERLFLLREIGNRIFRDRITSKKDIMVTFLGGADEVGRSSILVTTPESKIMLDCGVNLGVSSIADMFPRLDLVNLLLEDLDAVVLSHAHLDHSGFVPVLFKYGYEGPVYCTEPTLTLTTLLLTDALKVAEAEGKKLYYDMSHVKEFIKHCITLPYNFVTDIAPDVKLTLTNAGHILGSATIHLHIGQGLFNLVYTGDYKFGKSRLFQPANYIYPRVEALITESTYGGKDDIMPAREEAEERLISSINETVNQGGKVLIPVPAVGRAQEILLVLNDYISQKKLKEVPIYIEGMLTEATSIHLLYPEFLNKEIRDKIIFQGENPFITERYTIISHPKEREEVFAGGPSIIIATSGMLEGGPSIAYFSELSEDPRNKVIFVSYQVSGTMGRRVLDGSKQINIMDSNGKIRVINVNLKVEKIDGFSGHSDYNQLLNYISKFKNKVQKIIVVHGEDTKAKNLNESINRIVFRKNISEVPKVGETIKLY